MRKTLLLVSAFALMLSAAKAQDCNCMIELDETFQIVPMNGGVEPEYRNDDAFSPVITLPFTFDLYGTQHTECFINNNGNISFGNGYSTFTASGFPVAEFPMVAAFWGDVDTRNLESGLVYYKMLDNALIVRYHNVGYYADMADKVNDFQLIITDGNSDLISDGHNISFCYGDMQWTTGSASGGTDGFGGSPANVGANAGDGISALQIGLFNQQGVNYDGPFAEADGVDFLDYSNVSFSTNDIDENQYPINVSNLCDTIFGGAGDTLMFFFYDDLDQELDYDVTDSSGYINENDSLSGMIILNGTLFENTRTGNDRDLTNYSVGVIIADNIPDGVYPIYVSATDNGTPALTTTVEYTIYVGNGTPTAIVEGSQEPIVAYLNAGILNFKGLDDKNVEMFTLYNSNGQNILQTNKLFHGINMSQMATGVYLYTIKTNQGTFSGRFVK